MQTKYQTIRPHLVEAGGRIIMTLLMNFSVIGACSMVVQEAPSRILLIFPAIAVVFEVVRGAVNAWKEIRK